MYVKSRPVASTESSKRLKEMNMATTTILPHPMIIAGEEEERKAAQVRKRVFSFNLLKSTGNVLDCGNWHVSITD